MASNKVTQSAIAKHLDISDARVSQLIKAGDIINTGCMDEIRVQFIRWQRARIPGGGASKDLNAERARLASAQAEKAEMEIAEKKGDLLPVDSVAALWARVLTDCKSKLLSLPSKLAPQVVGKKREQARAIIELAIHDALRGLAETAGGDPGGPASSSEEDGQRVGGRQPKAEPGSERGAWPLEH